MRQNVRKIRFDIFLVLVFVCVEVFLFNMPFWQTLGGESSASQSVHVGPGIQNVRDGVGKVVDPSSAWIELHSQVPIKYLYINPSNGDSLTKTVNWKIETKKETDGSFFAAGSDRRYSTVYNNTRYMHFGNGITSIRFTYQAERDAVVPISSFIVNSHIPFHLSSVRCVVEILLLLFLLFCRPGSRLYRKRFSMRKPSSIVALSMTFMIQICCVLAVWFVSGGNNSPTGFGTIHWNGAIFDFDQYAHMAESLINGKVSLGLPVNSDLSAMVNPYDATSRFKVIAETHDSTPIFFDVAFKSGKYYSYFGVLPALLLFVPYRLLTGQNMPVGYAILALAVLVVFSSLLLVVQLARVFKRAGANPSVGCVVLIANTIALGYPLLTVLQQQLFYQLPQTLALALLLLGLSCWMESKLRGLSKPWLSLGSFMFGLILACRPQFALGAVVAFPLFATEIARLWKAGLKGWKNLRQELYVWSAAVLPFLIAVIPSLIYNKLRFGSLFDFGANYNLTGFDMTNQDLPWSQLFPLSFLYFLQPPNLSTQFPFIQATSQKMPLWIPMQPSFGGLFTYLAPFSLIGVLVIFWKQGTSYIKVRAICLSLLAYALAIFVLDAHVVGYDVRYVLDFGWAIMLIYAFALFVVDSHRDDARIQNLLTQQELSDDCEVRVGNIPNTVSIIVALVVVSAVLAWLFSFFSLFKVEPDQFNEALWWNVYSWFKFV